MTLKHNLVEKLSHLKKFRNPRSVVRIELIQGQSGISPLSGCMEMTKQILRRTTFKKIHIIVSEAESNFFCKL